MVRAPNGDLTVAATVSGTAMRLDRYDSAGKPLWARFMNRPSGDFLVGGWNAITGTDDGGVVVGGGITTIATAKTDLVLAQIDSAGNTVWLTEVDLGAGIPSNAGDGRRQWTEEIDQQAPKTSEPWRAALVIRSARGAGRRIAQDPA
jgi:hypothetical protein